MNDASVGVEPIGSIDAGLTSPAIEKPPATRTLSAVTSEAIRMAAGREACGVIDKISVSASRAECDLQRPDSWRGGGA
jgi:hypothetical protein